MPKNGKFDSAVQTYDWGVIHWRWFVMLDTVLLVAAAASGGRFLWFDTDYRVFFSKDNPQLLLFFFKNSGHPTTFPAKPPSNRHLRRVLAIRNDTPYRVQSSRSLSAAAQSESNKTGRILARPRAL